MAWSDAARAAAAEARRRKAKLNAENRLKAKAMAAFAPSAKMTPESAVRAFAPEVRRRMIGSRAYRLIDPDFAALPSKKPLSPAQKDAIYARKQRKAGKSSIFGGMVVRKRLKGFEY